MTQPLTLQQAHAYAQRHPLPETVRATLALCQCILGRGTHNTVELRAGMVLAWRRAVEAVHARS